ncbi:hypothetical protein VSK91_07540 [Bacillus swezeyi]|uniref:hypothetical protein n=1 Tax=Bacillus swezeyi TaxID=1925020 RepID=UPI0039C6D13B
MVDGTLDPGEKVTDFNSAEAFGVSRIPVREALQLSESLKDMLKQKYDHSPRSCADAIRRSLSSRYWRQRS